MSEQPSPSADADRWSYGWKAAVAYFQVDAEAFHTRNAATPPSIADMAPGTTLSFLRVDGVRVLGFVIDEHITIDVEGSAWRHDEIDPSTIRDVNPPESPNAN